jgi:hypothetical protein
MQDTLSHLIERTIHRNDTGKFLYILNQIDTTARENNPEDVIAAWQRALGERGLTAGRFYAVYNPDAAVPIEDESLRSRYETKRDLDLSEIHSRMEEVEIERAYRIVGALEKTARDIEERCVPLISATLDKWRKRVLVGDAVAMGGLILALLIYSINAGYWQGLSFQPAWLAPDANSLILWGILALLVILFGAIHFSVRNLAARTLLKGLRKKSTEQGIKGNPASAFIRSTKPWRSLFSKNPAGWGRRSRKQLQQVLQSTDTYIQTLNDQFTNPSGSEKLLAAEPATTATTAVAETEDRVPTGSA